MFTSPQNCQSQDSGPQELCCLESGWFPRGPTSAPSAFGTVAEQLLKPNPVAERLNHLEPAVTFDLQFLCSKVYYRNSWYYSVNQQLML